MPNLLPEKWKEALAGVSDKIGRFLDRFRGDRPAETSLENITADRFPAVMQFGSPLLDMYESGGELIVTAEVPGLKKEDFSIELLGRQLTIRGEKKFTRERKEGGIAVAELSYGSFSRSVLLPCEVKEREIRGDLKNGILTIRLKKPDATQLRKFRVPVS